MKSLILGGTGFIGRNLCLHLSRSGASVTTLSRSRLDDTLSRHIHVQADITDATAVRRAIGSCDVVYHLVHTSTPASAEVDWAKEVAENLLPSIDIVRACAKSGCKLVFASSGGTIYGIPKSVPVPESAAIEPVSAYGASKQSIENFLRLGSLRHGNPVTSLRVSNPFGPWQFGNKGQGAIAAFLSAAIERRPIQIWGDGSVVRDYIYIDDVVDAFIKAGGNSVGYNVYNVGSGVGRSLIEIIQAIERLIGHPIQRQYSRARQIDIAISVLDVGKAERELGWKPSHDFYLGLDRTYEAMRRLSADLFVHQSL